jgi:tetratricopeptide (TPR) repeat protein
MHSEAGSIRIDERTKAVAGFCRSSIFIISLLAPMLMGQRAFAQTQTPSDPAQEITHLAQQAEADLHGQRTTVAVEEYQKMLALDPQNIQAHANLGLAYYLQSEFALASGQFEAALRLKPDLWETAALCGLSEVQSGQAAAAKPHLQQAFERVTEPKLRMAVGRQLFSILFEAGDLQRASDVVSELEQLDPTNVDVIYAEHQVYSLLANRAFLSMAQLAPDSARMYQLRGDKMMQSGNLQGAIAAYREAIKRDAHLAGAHFTLGEALSASQSSSDRDQAEGEYQKALADNGRDERAECKLGAIDMDRSDLEGASLHFKRALQLQPDDSEANEGLGMVLMASKSSRDALVYLKRAVQLDPTDGAAHYRLALANRSLGDLEAANREMEEFHRLRTQKENLKQNFHELPTQTLSAN